MILQNENRKIAGTLINDLSSNLGKKGGCANTKDALVLMEAYQIIFRELGGIDDKKEKTSKIRQILNNSSCANVYKPIDYQSASITTISGGVTTSRKLPAFILALEMMTPKQRAEFQKALSEDLQIAYLNWNLNNADLKNEINQTLMDKEVIPLDLDKNLNKVFQSAIENNKSIKLEDYQIDKKELNKLLNNQTLINELNKEVIKQQD